MEFGHADTLTDTSWPFSEPSKNTIQKGDIYYNIWDEPLQRRVVIRVLEESFLHAESVFSQTRSTPYGMKGMVFMRNYRLENQTFVALSRDAQAILALV